LYGPIASLFERPAAVVVLAAGEGTRMNSVLPKVLHPIAGRPLLGHALAAAAGLDPRHLLVVIGHGREQVAAYLAEAAPAATPVVQNEQLGTGHAVRTALNTSATWTDGRGHLRRRAAADHRDAGRG
jgi:bifunctional UDP-N-acetylglucosamine pyrophosphorylase/glucosamine-1-phosphate N-acetyltransferase